MNKGFHIKRRVIAAIASLALLAPLYGEQDVPLMRPEEMKVVDAQTAEFGLAITPALKVAGQSTVRVWSEKDLISYGTVIGDGREILTKWSEVDRVKQNLIVQTADSNDVRQATIDRVYEDEDMAVLKITGDPLVPVKWVDKDLALGSFMAATQPDGRLAGFGVVSVLARNLRETDHAFLGVVGAVGFDGEGVKVHQISEGSGAEEAGLKSGDIILKTGERKISGLLELQNSLVGTQPGDTIELLVKRLEKLKKFKVTLGNRPELPSIRGDRLQKMERMGTRLNVIRDSFSNAVQTDMALDPNQMGGPVVNLQGEVIGLAVARADRTRSFIIPSATVQQVLQTEGLDPKLAQVPSVKKPKRVVRLPTANPPPRGPSPEQMQQHLDEMRRLMGFMQDEMDALQRDR